MESLIYELESNNGDEDLSDEDIKVLEEINLILDSLN